MKTDIQQISDVEYELEIKASSDDLSEDLDRALRAQRTRTNMKGFRQGKVPLSMVKKLYGKALAYGVAEDVVQKTFQSEVYSGDTYDVLGQPTITDLDYEYEGDLRAVVRFGVRPTIKLADLTKVKVMRLTHDVTDEDVEKEVDSMRANHADLIPEEGPAGEESYVIVDMQLLDAESGTPVVGEKKEDLPFLLSDENLIPDLRTAIVGLEPGGTSRVTLPAQEEGGEDRSYEVALKEVKRRELPELDEELVKEVTNDQLDSPDALREEIRTQIERGWKRRISEFFEADVIEKMIELHEFDVPESVVDMYLDAYVKDVKAKNDDKLPEDFDEEAFRKERRPDAENQAHWMFIRDAVISEEGLDVTDADRDAQFEVMAGEGGFPPEMMKRYYEQSPQMLDQFDQKILSEKVFARLAEKMDVEEKDFHAYNEELKEGKD